MISERINKKMLATKLLESLDLTYFLSKFQLSETSYLFKAWMWSDPVTPMIDEFFDLFDAETLPEVQKNINLALTASKHLLNCDKQDLIWFQKTLARMKNVRGAFKN